MDLIVIIIWGELVTVCSSYQKFRTNMFKRKHKLDLGKTTFVFIGGIKLGG